MPKEYMEEPPKGKLITSVEGHPIGLLAIQNPDGSPRIIVPRSQVLALVLQTHEDIHHQPSVPYQSTIHPDAAVLLAGNGQRHGEHLHGLPNMHDSVH